MYRTILVPTDGSSLSAQAAAAAIELARACGSSIVAMSVAQIYPQVAVEAALAVETAADSRVQLETAQQNVDQVAEAAAKAGVPCTTAVALSFTPHEEIIKAARDHQCDLIFMASHGRRGVSRLLLGSVAQNVLAESDIPVLVLRPPGLH